jgi:hypothetical protein
MPTVTPLGLATGTTKGSSFAKMSSLANGQDRMRDYRTLEDLRNIVLNGIPEGVVLEYKAASALDRGNFSHLCKAVTAFANSAGGQFIIGIETEKNIPKRVDEGLSGPRRDWI